MLSHMDAQQALADLTEISSQIQAAAVFDDEGRVAASTLGDPDRANEFVRAASDLLAQAEGIAAANGRWYSSRSRRWRAACSSSATGRGGLSRRPVRGRRAGSCSTTSRAPSASCLRRQSERPPHGKRLRGRRRRRRRRRRPRRRSRLQGQRNPMRRSAATFLGLAGGVLAGAAFIRRRGVRQERVDLYYEDGSMVSLANGSADAARLLPLAREILQRWR